MPGVPSGRGCEGCRSRKKKCDLSQPTCGRCARLRIPCVGSGKRRFKFMEEHGPATRVPVVGFSDNDRKVATLTIHASPSNEINRLTSSYLKTIKRTTDMRYNLVWSLGGYLVDIPARLGRNEALDASVKALVAGHSYYCSREKPVDEALTSYSHALRALRNCLDDPAIARTSETLCAAMLMNICQCFLGWNGVWTSAHGEGTAQLIKARGYYDPKDDFENKMLLSLRGSMVFEGIFNPNVSLTPHEWKILVENHFDGVSHEGKMMRALSRLPNIIQGKPQGTQTDEEILSLVEDTKADYEVVKVMIDKIKPALDQVRKDAIDESSMLSFSIQSHCYLVRAYGLALSIGAIVNCVLNAFDPTNMDLKKENIHFSNEIWGLIDECELYKPVGAMCVPIFLNVAWMGAVDEERKLIIKKRMEDFLVDPRNPYDFPHLDVHLERTVRHLRLEAPLVSLPST